MKIWIGHFHTNEKEWFIAWGNSKEEVINYIDSTMAEPDVQSMKAVRTPGFFCFKARIKKYEDLEFPAFKLHEDELFFDDDKLNDWIITRMKKPIREPKTREVSELASRLGISQSEVFMTYMPACPKCGGKPYFKEKGCKKCGYKEE